MVAFLADECFSGQFVRDMQAAGFDVTRSADFIACARDEKDPAFAYRQGRVSHTSRYPGSTGVGIGCSKSPAGTLGGSMPPNTEMASIKAIRKISWHAPDGSTRRSYPPLNNVKKLARGGRKCADELSCRPEMANIPKAQVFSISTSPTSKSIRSRHERRSLVPMSATGWSAR